MTCLFCKRSTLMCACPKCATCARSMHPGYKYVHNASCEACQLTAYKRATVPTETDRRRVANYQYHSTPLNTRRPT